MKTKLLFILFIIGCTKLNAQIIVNGTGGAIPDNDPTGITFTANATSGTIANITVDLDISHTWVGDIIVSVTSPHGTTVTIVDRPGVPNTGVGCNNDNMNITLFDGAIGDIEACPSNGNSFSGDYDPSNPLSSFTGEDTLGTWSINISDSVNQDQGTLNSWTLNINTQANPIVNIPDANFKAALVSNIVINTNNDTEIQVSEATAYTGIIDVNNLNISDLTGIETFTALTILKCNTNQLTSLDVTQNTALIELVCFYNQITSLDVSQNTALTTLYFNDNQISIIDVSQNTNLEVLSCSRNQLSSLDVSQNMALTSLEFNNNQINSIDPSQNILLSQLSCSSNQLTSLDITQNTLLTHFFCENNLLTSIDISQNTAFVNTNFSNNKFTELDFSPHTNLHYLTCTNNPFLNSLDIRNNSNIDLISFDLTSNSNLTCVYVDDTTTMETNFPNAIDANTTYVENQAACNALDIVNIPDVNFKAALVGNTSINTNNDTEIQVSEATDYSGIINVNGFNISDLTGIETFTSITSLYCENNQLTNIDVTQNNDLINFSCSNNQIVNLDISNNIVLKKIYCYNNQITNLDISQNTILETLTIVNNQIASLDITNNTLLIELYCNGNQLTNLDISQNTALDKIYCAYNQISSLNVTNNTLLIELHCNYNQLTNLDVSQNTALEKLYCTNNQITSLDLRNGNNSNLTTFTALSNPNLTCVYVDDTITMETNFPNAIDSNTTYVENEAACTALATDNYNLDTISIYPNPTKDYLQINIDTEIKSIFIYNVLGKKILETKNKTISVSNMDNGIYFLHITTTNNNNIRKEFIVKK